MDNSVYGKLQQRTGLMIKNALEDHGLPYRTLLGCAMNKCHWLSNCFSDESHGEYYSTKGR